MKLSSDRKDQMNEEADEKAPTKKQMTAMKRYGLIAKPFMSRRMVALMISAEKKRRKEKGLWP